MATTASRQRPSVAARRSGYVVAAVVNGLVLYLVNRRPGWEVLPFLTPETTKVLGLVNASIIAGIVTNLVYLVADPPRLRSLGDLVTTGIGLAAMVRIWQVWPISFEPGGFPWDTVLRWLVGIGIVGSAIGIVVALVTLVRGTHR
jgi:hypothetical protein